jgi:hypothetical protein
LIASLTTPAPPSSKTPDPVQAPDANTPKKSSKGFMMGFILMAIIAALGYWKYLHKPSSTKNSQTSQLVPISAQSIPTNKTLSDTSFPRIITNTTVSSPEVTITAPSNGFPPTMAALVYSVQQKQLEEEKARQLAEVKAKEAVEKAALEKKRAQELQAEMEKYQSQIGALITNQLEEVSIFQTNCHLVLNEALKHTGLFSSKRKEAIKALQTIVDKSTESQLLALRQWQTQLQLFPQTPSSSWPLHLDKITKTTQAMLAQRQQLASQVMQYKKK